MKNVQVSGTEGYAEAAEFLIPQWKEISFSRQHQIVMHLLPTAPARILDLGAGIGRDAAAFATMGHQVVAVEPTRELRQAGMTLHASTSIDWLDDSLPDLTLLRSRKEQFDLIMLTAVWMHLDSQEREQAMHVLTELLADTGLLIMSLRHGAIPAGRRMFDVSADETINLAHKHGLNLELNKHTASLQKTNQQNGVTWTRLAFRRKPS
ncbi:class I SAM-dependent methyltransferase [Undibacterium sp. TS12]|uniref:class I SAM-dependent methyltransferase n=1 Tax=Undibacterium sp. TS12 TaxID=2908202 RepID=UPI001F4C6468|nr:class I SAM-dependent methyltransferase [Undibacterium sp. TS12]MCH8617568.1 class I SAM-dependent methyltransferase [Undibacterium sp. TS12]